MFYFLVRFVWVMMDPLWAYAYLDDVGQQVLSTGHIPFSLATCLLICLVLFHSFRLCFSCIWCNESYFQYWFELLNKTKLKPLASKVGFLQRLKWPFAVIVVLLIILELTSSILRGVPGNNIGSSRHSTQVM
jgi:hypothetical protein